MRNEILKHTDVKLEINTPAQMRTGGLVAHWRRRGRIVASLYHRIVISLLSLEDEKECGISVTRRQSANLLQRSLAQFEDLNAPPPSCENGIQGKSC